MNFAFILLSILNIMAELTELSYELGSLTRKYIVPAFVAVYVIGEMAWDSLTTVSFDIEFCNKNLALVRA